MSGDVHVRFWEGAGVRLPRATHLPLHRLQRAYERQGYFLHRSTLCDWLGANRIAHLVVAQLLIFQ